ncbi:hypothetical protein Dimus_038140 [Dionaea muscipula]
MIGPVRSRTMTPRSPTSVVASLGRAVTVVFTGLSAMSDSGVRSHSSSGLVLQDHEAACSPKQFVKTARWSESEVVEEDSRTQSCQDGGRRQLIAEPWDLNIRPVESRHEVSQGLIRLLSDAEQAGSGTRGGARTGKLTHKSLPQLGEM